MTVVSRMQFKFKVVDRRLHEHEVGTDRFVGGRDQRHRANVGAFHGTVPDHHVRHTNHDALQIELVGSGQQLCLQSVSKHAPSGECT